MPSVQVLTSVKTNHESPPESRVSSCRDLASDLSARIFGRVQGIWDGYKNNHFGPFYTILGHFGHFRRALLFKKMGNFEILAKSLPSWCEQITISKFVVLYFCNFLKQGWPNFAWFWLLFCSCQNMLLLPLSLPSLPLASLLLSGPFLCPAIQCPALPSPRFLFCHVLSCPALPSPACLALPCPALLSLPYPVLPFPTLVFFLMAFLYSSRLQASTIVTSTPYLGRKSLMNV